MQSQSENAQEMPRQRIRPNAPRHDTDEVLTLPLKSHVLDRHVYDVTTLCLSHRGRRKGTERGQETSRERETERKKLGLSSTSEWTQKTPVAKRDTKSDAGHKQGTTTGSPRVSRVRSRNFSASLECEGKNETAFCP